MTWPTLPQPHGGCFCFPIQPSTKLGPWGPGQAAGAAQALNCSCWGCSRISACVASSVLGAGQHVPGLRGCDPSSRAKRSAAPTHCGKGFEEGDIYHPPGVALIPTLGSPELDNGAGGSCGGTRTLTGISAGRCPCPWESRTMELCCLMGPYGSEPHPSFQPRKGGRIWPGQAWEGAGSHAACSQQLENADPQQGPSGRVSSRSRKPGPAHTGWEFSAEMAVPWEQGLCMARP